jgi:hypothetical protein
MPTAAKLFGAIAFAIVGWISANAFAGVLPEGRQIGFMREIVAFVGLVCGWRVAGALAGKGYSAAIGSGVRAGITMAFFALLGFALYEMVILSTKMRYDGPMEAVLDVFNIMLGYAKLGLTPEILGVFFGGSIIGGWIAEFAGRHWK